MQLIGLLPDGTFGLVVFSFPSSALVDGAQIPLNLVSGTAYLVHFDPTVGEPTLLGFLLDGTLTIETGSPVDGAPLEATFASTLMGPG